VFTAGHGYQQAVSSRPRLITVVGMWLIFGPQVVMLLIGLSVLMSDLFATGRIFLPGQAIVVGRSVHVAPDDLVSVALKLVLVVGLLAIYSTILWKVTRRYQARAAADQGDNCG